MRHDHHATGEVRSRPSVIAYVLGGLALAALLAMSILFVASGLLAPSWAVIGFIAAWAILFVLGCVWIRRHPWRVLLAALGRRRHLVWRHQRR